MSSLKNKKCFICGILCYGYKCSKCNRTNKCSISKHMAYKRAYQKRLLEKLETFKYE